MLWPSNSSRIKRAEVALLFYGELLASKPTTHNRVCTCSMMVNSLYMMQHLNKTFSDKQAVNVALAIFDEVCVGASTHQTSVTRM